MDDFLKGEKWVQNIVLCNLGLCSLRKRLLGFELCTQADAWEELEDQRQVLLLSPAFWKFNLTSPFQMPWVFFPFFFEVKMVVLCTDPDSLCMPLDYVVFDMSVDCKWRFFKCITVHIWPPFRTTTKSPPVNSLVSILHLCSFQVLPAVHTQSGVP